jgi:hypothetical protein
VKAGFCFVYVSCSVDEKKFGAQEVSVKITKKKIPTLKTTLISLFSQATLTKPTFFGQIKK